MKLLAYTPQERWAFVEDGDRILFVRPPFTTEEVVTRVAVERAVTVDGYLASERQFGDLAAIRVFLEGESVRVWKEQHQGQTLASLQADLLDALTEADIDRQLSRVQQRIDESKRQEALRLVTRLVAAKHATPEQRARLSTMMGTLTKSMTDSPITHERQRNSISRHIKRIAPKNTSLVLPHE